MVPAASHATRGPRTLIARADGIWMWPGIPLSVRQGPRMVPIPLDLLRFWTTRLHGPSVLYKPLDACIARACEHINAQDEIRAQAVLDDAGLDWLSPDGAALVRGLARHLTIDPIVLPIRNGPPTWSARDVAFHLPVFEARTEAVAGLAKAWDESKHPRWPAGEPDGGQFKGADDEDDAGPLVEGRSQTGPGIGHNGGPLFDPEKGLPEQEPPRKIRYGLIRGLARLTIEATAAGLHSLVNRILFNIQVLAWVARLGYDRQLRSNLDPPKSLEELKSAVDNPMSGYEVHHIVEKKSASRAALPKSKLNRVIIWC